jgi:hypothetical protein
MAWRRSGVRASLGPPRKIFMQEKVPNATLIPGWMGAVMAYKKYIGIDIWLGKDFPTDESVKTPWIIAHSLGAHFALQAWHQDKEKKFILVNPLLKQKKPSQHIFAWLKFFFTEGPDISKKISLLNLPAAIRKFFLLDKINLEDILKNISPERLTVVRGKRDKFLCDDVCVALIKKYNLRLIEIENVGHNWDNRVDAVIEKIIQA